MRASRILDRDAVMAVLDRYRAAVAELADLPRDALGVPDMFTVLNATADMRSQAQRSLMRLSSCDVAGVVHTD